VSGAFLLDTPVVRAFVTDVKATIASTPSPEDACEALRPRFAELLADPDWLPAEYQAPAPESGMGGGIGQWALYRSEDGSLSLFALVVPSGSETPIHDHLAWGLVGLYRGDQDEEIYRRANGSLELVEQRPLRPGDFYVLIPPRDDIHRVRTTSRVTSVSIHLLTNDTGCVWRHAYDESGESRPFRSGGIHLAAALVVGIILGPVLHVVPGLPSVLSLFVALFAVGLPAITYMLLVGMWLVQLAAGQVSTPRG